MEYRSCGSGRIEQLLTRSLGSKQFQKGGPGAALLIGAGTMRYAPAARAVGVCRWSAWPSIPVLGGSRERWLG